MDYRKDWIETTQAVPVENVVVDTKIDNEKGLRNETPLKRQGNFWFFPDGSMYVYYTPTHWRELAATPGTHSGRNQHDGLSADVTTQQAVEKRGWG